MSVIVQHAQHLDDRARRVAELSAHLVALAEQSRPAVELTAVHNDLADELEALSAQSSILAAHLSDT